MKKTNIFLSAMLIATSINLKAQTIASAVVTGNVGIGTGTVPTDARLHIHNLQSIFTPSIPEIVIDRTTLGSITNFFQISDHNVFYPTATVLDVINPSGWYGILQPKPTQPLDVKGNGLIENTLMVSGGLIDMSQPVYTDTWRNIQANSNSQGISLSSKTNSSNGSCIEMYSGGHTTDPGSIHYISYGSIGTGHLFLNYASGSWHTDLTIQKNGHTFVGHDINLSSTNPNNILTIQDQMGFISSNDINWRNIDGNTNTGALTISSKTGSADGSSIELYGAGHATRPGDIHYISSGSTGYGHEFINYTTATSWTSHMAIGNDGRVVIGKDLIDPPATITNPTPAGYLLYVEKGILTEKLRVANSTDGANWADFVFNKNYKLMPLDEVEGYVNLNKHLPEIPSANDVAKDGIDVAGIDAKLLQKIEELTLYVIQQQKEIDELKKEIKK